VFGQQLERLIEVIVLFHKQIRIKPVADDSEPETAHA
jgi:hypothetical protein